MTLARLAERIRLGELSPREAVQASLERIEASSELNAFISVRGEEALAEADRAPDGPLRGVPVAVKDVIDVAGARTTAASEILRENLAARDADAVARLRAAGAVIVGKLNTHEFAFGALTTSPHFGAARNPWDSDRVCGGSSGGSGAAVAASLVTGTLGTDTAGSIRIPACFCGVTGLRPSTGLVSNRGVVPTSWRFDTVGPLARTAEDCSLLLEALAPAYRPELGGGVAGVRIGVVEELFDRAEPAIAERARAAVDELRSLGAEVEPVVVPLLEEAGTIVQALMLPEAAQAHLGWLRTRLADYGSDVRVRLLAGLLLPATAYVTGLRAQRWYLGELRTALDQYDLLAQPALPMLPPRIGEEMVVLHGETLPFRLAVIPFNSPWTLAGAPVASVPCGFVAGLPVGLALAGRPGEEATVLRAAATFQRASDWHSRRPEPAVGTVSTDPP
ncbi:MAG TPA: amidase [Gaiellaceae bacterium]|nr:amidase [Gaiellaceae bacterium]